MATKIINVPGVGLVEFPGTMSDAAIEAVLRASPQAMAGQAPPAAGRSFGDDVVSVAAGGTDVAKKSLLPTLGGVAGGALGALTGPAAPVAVPAGASLGSMAGVKANEML